MRPSRLKEENERVEISKKILLVSVFFTGIESEYHKETACKPTTAWLREAGQPHCAHNQYHPTVLRSYWTKAYNLGIWYYSPLL